MKFWYVFLWITFQVFSFPDTIAAQNCDIKIYNSDHGLPQNNLTQLMFDLNDKLWIGTQGGLCVFDGLSFQKIFHKDLSTRITYIHKSGHGDLYINDDLRNIFQSNLKNLKIKKLNQRYELSDVWIVNKKDYVGFENYYKNTHIHTFLSLNLGYKNYKEFKKNGSRTYIKYSKRFAKFKGYFLLDTVLIGLDEQAKWIKYIDENNQVNIISSLPQDFKTKGFVFNTDHGTYWLYNNTIFKIELLHHQLKSVPVLKNVPLDPLDNRITCGQYNKNTGIFYFGSAKNGLYEVKANYFNNKKPVSKNLSEVLLSNGQGYYSQSEIDSSTIFVNNFIILKDSLETLVPNIKSPYIRSVNMVDDKGWLWYADDKNIIIQKALNRKIISLAPLTQSIVSMCQTSKDNYLLLSPQYIIEIDTSKVIKRINLRDFMNENTEYGKYLYYDEFTKKIFLLSNLKIYYVNVEQATIKPITSIPQADYQIMSPISKDLFFVGTYGQGYLIFDGKKWYPMPLDKKEHLKFTHAALCDSNGHVWMSTNNGLFRVRIHDLENYITGKSKDIFYYYYDKSAGFLTNEFNGGCQSPAIKLKDDRFSFSSMVGLVQFDPTRVPALFPKSKLNIVQVFLNRHSQDSIPGQLVITQDIKDIKLEVSCPFYGHPDNMEVQYKIPGNLDQWTDLIDHKYIVLQNLRNGSFVVNIRKRNGFANGDFDYLYYPITVMPYYYQTWWFLSLLGLGCLIVFLGLVKWYSRNLAEQKLKLEALVRERNESLINTNMALEDKIKQNEMFHSVMVHDIKAPLFFMGTISDEMLKGLDHLSKDDIRNNISSVKQAASHLSNFIVNFLTWVKSKNHNLSLQNEMVNLAEIMYELKTFYSHTDKIMKGRLSILIECNDDLQVPANKQLLLIILGNLLSNSIKFSTQGTITLYAYITDEGSTVIGCKDQGKGMDSHMIALLTDKGYKGNSIREDSFRMGYVFINDIINIMNAVLSIKSILGQGTDVSVEIRL